MNDELNDLLEDHFDFFNENKKVETFKEYSKIKESKRNYNLYKKNKDLENEIENLKDKNFNLKIKLEHENRYKKISTCLFVLLSIFTCINLGNQTLLCYSYS